MLNKNDSRFRTFTFCKFSATKTLRISSPKLILHKQCVKQASVWSNFAQCPSSVVIINWAGANMDVCENEILHEEWKSCCFVVVFSWNLPAVISRTRQFIDCRSYNWLPVICLATIFRWTCMLISTAGWLARLGWCLNDLSFGVQFQKWRKISSSLPPHSHNTFGSHPSSSPMGTIGSHPSSSPMATRGLLPWSKSVEALCQQFTSI